MLHDVMCQIAYVSGSHVPYVVCYVLHVAYRMLRISHIASLLLVMQHPLRMDV